MRQANSPYRHDHAPQLVNAAEVPHLERDRELRAKREKKRESRAGREREREIVEGKQRERERERELRANTEREREVPHVPAHQVEPAGGRGGGERG